MRSTAAPQSGRDRFAGFRRAADLIDVVVCHPARGRESVLGGRGEHELDRALQVAEVARRDEQRRDAVARADDRADDLPVIQERTAIAPLRAWLLVPAAEQALGTADGGQ